MSLGGSTMAVADGTFAPVPDFSGKSFPLGGLTLFAFSPLLKFKIVSLLGFLILRQELLSRTKGV